MSTSGDLKRSKRAARAAARAARDGIAAVEREAACRRIVASALALPELLDARVVMGYVAIGSEVDPAPLLDAVRGRGGVAALPRIEGDVIVAVAHDGASPLAPSGLGTPEPVSGERLSPTEVDVVVLPGLAFDAEGGRLGYGGGFYDRYLTRTRSSTWRIGLAFDEQIVDAVPRGGHDLAVDAVVTPTRVLRVPRRTR